MKVTSDIDQETIDRFVRFLERDINGKIDYIAFIERMSDIANVNHNPFKQIVQRLAFFIESNKQTVSSIIKRLAMKAQSEPDTGVPTAYFAEFLKAKIDKKRSETELARYAYFIDIDKDGFVSEVDLRTCIENLSSDTFFRDSGEALAVSAFSSQRKFFPASEQLTAERALEVAKQFKAALVTEKLPFREAFNRFDKNQDGFLSYAEFSAGVDSVMTMSAPMKEKFFSSMDANHIGMIDYPSFLQML